MLRFFVLFHDLFFFFFFFKQKTAYEIRISDWSSDVCSSDLVRSLAKRGDAGFPVPASKPETRTMRPSDSQRGRRVTLKRLFEISVNAGEDTQTDTDTLIALADDERDVRALAEVRAARIVKLVALPGLVTAVGTTRLIESGRASGRGSGCKYV